MSVDLSGEITAVATAVLALFAIVTAIYAIRAFLKQSREVSDQAEMLKVQSAQLDEQRKLNADQTKVLELQAAELAQSLTERRTAQASRVFIWIEPADIPPLSPTEHAMGLRSLGGVIAHLKNASRYPVYDVQIAWHKGTAPWGEPDCFPVLMPDKQEDSTHIYTEDLPANVDRSLFGAVARFRDAAGVHWRVRPDGHLEEEPATK